MALGGGKYDAVATRARAEAMADGVVLLVIGGKHGGGFSVQVPPEVLLRLPDILELMAKEIRADLNKVQQ